MIYLDNAATSMIHPEVMKNSSEILGMFGNPSSLHSYGLKARRMLEETRELVAKSLGAQSEEIYFFSSATEINNWVLTAFLREKKSGHVLTTYTEHPSVYKVLKEMEKEGFQVEYVKPKAMEPLKEKDFLEKVRKDTILIAMQHVNNETGVIYEIPKTKIPLFVDGAQSYRKIPLSVKEKDMDFLSVSPHKVGALKGLGVLYMKKGRKLSPWLLGGDQEKGLRSSTENMPAILSLKTVLENPVDFPSLKEVFMQELKDSRDVIFHTHENTAPHILLMETPGVAAEVLVNQLSSVGIYVSTGSACSEKKKYSSRSYSLLSSKSNNFIRISFSPWNTKEEVKKAGVLVKESVEKILQYMGRYK